MIFKLHELTTCKQGVCKWELIYLFFSPLNIYLSSSCCSILLNHYQHKTETRPVERWYSWQQCSPPPPNTHTQSPALTLPASCFQRLDFLSLRPGVDPAQCYHCCLIFITTQSQNTHMQLIWGPIYKDGGTNHTNVDTLYLPYQLPTMFLSLFLWWKGDWDIPSINIPPSPCQKGINTADATTIVSYLFILSLKL